MIRPVAAAAAAALLLAAGCTGGGPEKRAAEAVASPLAGCEELTAPPPGAAGAAEPADPAERAEPAEPSEPSGGDQPGRPMPSLTLPCFTGDAPVALPDLRGPAVLNLWASWCRPCREELPVLQRYADRAAGEVHVVGVITADERGRAAALAEDLDLTFPALFDPAEALRGEVGGMGLPVTLFIDRDGRVAYFYQGAPLDDQALSGLVEEHLQVSVAAGRADG